VAHGAGRVKPTACDGGAASSVEGMALQPPSVCVCVCAPGPTKGRTGLGTRRTRRRGRVCAQQDRGEARCNSGEVHECGVLELALGSLTLAYGRKEKDNEQKTLRFGDERRGRRTACILAVY